MLPYGGVIACSRDLVNSGDLVEIENSMVCLWLYLYGSSDIVCSFHLSIVRSFACNCSSIRSLKGFLPNQEI